MSAGFPSPAADFPRQADLAERRLAWTRLFAAEAWGQLVHERFALASFPGLARALHAQLERIALYAFADDAAPVGVQLVFPDVTIHSVPGLSGNVVLTGKLDDFFAFPVWEYQV
ncbi:hypothetical protein IC235_17370 [Hymenobacter sp. BT664]|uniref:Uncharacterized protein n=1 Tax=Hymenobacter montanus TaxID=2771359 RepID=A0A927BGV0_9BACT|nr:hypothetical protein [Hymenobacter montanus]MBD2769663.1 hypothetical protein [Hymenobacter montanus]